MIGELYRIELISEPNPVAEAYARLHEQRWGLVDERRRARDYQAELADAQLRNLALAAENARILAIIADAQRRHSAGSHTRAVLDAIALEIAEWRDGEPIEPPQPASWSEE